MKVPKKGKDKINKVNKKGAVAKIKPKKEKVLVVAQEIKYARLLSGNEKNTRDRVLKALKKWLTNCFEKGYEFKEDDFTRVWKGLFYAMWMSDKPLIQEELCENISGILDLFPAEQLRPALLMAKAGFKTLATEWYGIDQHRMDKFLMLVRRYLRGSLRILNRCNWSLKSCEKYATMLTHGDGLFALKTPHYARNANSMLLHFVDCFLEELAKVSQGAISEESVAALLKPFTAYTCSGGVPTLCAACRRLLTALLRQSETGLQYQDKTRAWQRMGCPGSGPDVLEPASDDEEETEGGDDPDILHMDDGVEKPLDPRAGRVDVELPLLPVPADLLANMLRGMLANATSKAHKRVKICLQRFESLAAGTYPLRVSAPDVDSSGVVAMKPTRSARALRALEARIKSDTDELKLRGLSRKHRKRLLKKTRAGQSIVEEVASATNNSQKNGEWLVETTEKTEIDDTSNKENQNKKKNKKSKDKTQKRKLETQNGDVASKKMKVDEKKGKKKESLSKESSKESLTKGTTKESLRKENSKEILGKKDVKAKEVKLNRKMKEKDTNKQVQKQIQKESPKKEKKEEKKLKKQSQKVEPPKLLINKLKHFSNSLQKDKKDAKNFQKETKNLTRETKNSTKDTKKFSKETKNFEKDYDTPKKVKFVLKNNSMQKPVDYYKSVRQSPSIPFDSTKKPSKTNLKVSTPSPINPFFKKKLRMKH